MQMVLKVVGISEQHGRRQQETQEEGEKKNKGMITWKSRESGQQLNGEGGPIRWEQNVSMGLHKKRLLVFK